MLGGVEVGREAPGRGEEEGDSDQWQVHVVDLKFVALDVLVVDGGVW